MLTDITLKNFTVIHELHLELPRGLCVISGETGAGKSILIDAIELALGARGDAKFIRPGALRAEISVNFMLNTTARAWLVEHDYHADEECLLIRILQQDGRSRLTLNGKPIALNLAREFSHYLIHIHSQHESYTLLQRQHQEELVDLFAQNGELLQTLKKCVHAWRDAESELKQLELLSQQREQQLGLLHYQLEELQTLNLQPNEWESLHREHQQLHNANTLIQQINNAMALTMDHEEYSSNQLLQQAIRELESVSATSPELTEILNLLHTAAIHLQEAGDGLNRYRNALDLSPERLTFIESRLSTIYDMARKHHCAAEELEQTEKSLHEKISHFSTLDEKAILLRESMRLLVNEYQHIAAKISHNRQKVAPIISEKISEDMQILGMQGGEFSVHLETHTTELSPTGNEKIEFWVKTNPGQLSQPLAKIVSGGELSRLALSLQSLIAKQEPTPTFVFDEVDSGIGGQTAEVVGNLLRQFAEDRQVFCITHLPQVAAAGLHHFQVIKQREEDSTSITIKLLSPKERIYELARMISGSKISNETLKHAEQLLL